jgi:hypothetical protein
MLLNPKWQISMTAIEPTNRSTCVHVRKGHSQKPTADSPAKYLIAVTTNRFIGPIEGALASWSLDAIREEGALSAAPTLGAKDSSSISGSTTLAAGGSGGVLICSAHPGISYRQHRTLKPVLRTHLLTTKFFPTSTPAATSAPASRRSRYRSSSPVRRAPVREFAPLRSTAR